MLTQRSCVCLLVVSFGLFTDKLISAKSTQVPKEINNQIKVPNRPKEAPTRVPAVYRGARQGQHPVPGEQSRPSDPCPLQCACEIKPVGHQDELSVSCENANFSTIPHFPQNSVEIVIRKGSIYHIQEYAFSGLRQMVILRLESRAPWTVSEKAFWGINALSYLYLEGHSPGAKHFPPNIFKDAKALSSLTVRRLPIEVQSEILCPLKSIKYLALINNGLKHLKFDQCFLKFNKLSNLIISNNPVIIIMKSDLDNLKNSPIASLSINNCKLQTLEVDLVSLFPSLVAVSLSDNKLIKFGAPKSETHLQQIDIGRNLFTSLPCTALSKMPKLVKLISSHNTHMKVTLCESLTSLTSLTELRLDWTPIDFIGDAFFKALETAPIRIVSLTARKISPLAFIYVKKLEYITMSGYLSYQGLIEGLTSLGETNVTHLFISFTQPLMTLANDMFVSLKSTKLTTLTINACSIRAVSKGTFSVLPWLEELDLHNNKITYLPNGVFESLTALQNLDLGNNNLLTWGGGYIPWGIRPNLQRLNLKGNLIKTIPSRMFKHQTNLSDLKLGHNQIRTIAPSAFEGTQLTRLTLNNNLITQIQKGLLDNCPNLQHIDISANILQFDASMLYNPFKHLAKITHIRMSEAAFQSTSPNSQLGYIFQNLNELIFLTVSNCGLTWLPLTMFKNTTNLESLILSSNSIVSWNMDLFKPVQQLKLLNLAKNKITNVNKASFVYLPSLRRLDLSLNALVCNCDLVWFRSWITNVYIYLEHIQQAGTYLCAAPESERGTDLLHFDLSEEDCVDKTMLTLSISLSISAVFVACLSLTAYRYRFHLYYVFFYVRYRRRRLREAEDNTNYVNDAFIAYNADDGAWVINELLPKLEYDRGFKLCLHHRDWLAGKDIIDNIVTSIESSRKVILVLSNKFASSHWCQVEATMSQTRMLDGGRNPLILVLLEDIKSRNMTSTLRYLMTSQTYLPWPNEERDQEVFWRRLAVAMKGPRGRRGILYRAAQEKESEGEDDTE